MNLNYVLFNFAVLSTFHLSHVSSTRLKLEKIQDVNRENRSADFEMKTDRQKWISELMEDAKHLFEMDRRLVNSACRRDFMLYKLHLQNQSIWALRMQESSEWPSTGLFAGMVYSLGNWDECVRVSKYNVKGQYCLATAAYKVTKKKVIQNQLDWPDEGASAWSALQKYESMPWILNRQKLHWAMCIPASCESSDLVRSLEDVLGPIFQRGGLEIAVQVDPNFCSTKEKTTQFSTGFYIICLLIVTGIIIQVTSTLLDILNYSDEEVTDRLAPNRRSIIKCFSWAYNWKCLIIQSSQSAEVHVFKIFNSLFVIYGHRLIFTFGYPTFNTEKLERELYSKDSVSSALRGTFLVDGFFVISAFLTYYHGISKAKENGMVFVAYSIIMRWIRMLPSFIWMMLLIINFLPFTSQGPFWKHRINTEVENCSESFWCHIFAVGNLIKPNKMCTFVSWYISVDIQLTVLGVSLVYILSRKKSTGIFLMSTFLLTSSVAISFVIYFKKYHILLPAYLSVLEDVRKNEEFTSFYATTYFRVPVYILGLATAMAAEKMKQRNYKTSDLHVGLLIVFSFFIKCFMINYVVKFFEFVQPYDGTEQALSVVFLRLINSLPECGMLMLCFSSDLGFFSKFFQYKIYTVVGRLTYCMFIVHIVIQIFHAASFQVFMPTYSNLYTFWTVCGDVVFSLLGAFFLHIFVEAPAYNLSTIIMQLIFKKKEPNKNNCKSD